MELSIKKISSDINKEKKLEQIVKSFQCGIDEILGMRIFYDSFFKKLTLLIGQTPQTPLLPKKKGESTAVLRKNAV